MAKKTSKAKKDLAEQTDPRATLDSAALLAASKPVQAKLEASLLERVKSSPAVTAALDSRYQAEKANHRTAESFDGWTTAIATQVAAAWLLSCVFVRTLEDRGLLKQNRLAGPGAEDSQRQFFALAPSLTERDYLLTVFRELARHPAARALFDAEHSLVWKLSPSAEVAKELLALFRTPTATAPAFRFGQSSTRFLGDLYQDLSEEVRKRYALLQTPDFVEEFILDRTLEPAIARFGIDDVTLIDPTCGSGHFLLGAFDRLFEHRLRAEPGIDPRVACVKALDGVYGADVNPYAVAIARFRLTLSFLEKAGYARLGDAPALPLHLVVADSLRINAQHHEPELWHQDGVDARAWLGDVFSVEDERAARDVLFRQYAAVVGNPPYITVKDAALREVYRAMYPTCYRTYSLSVPFCERFFQLARPRGYTGQITANSFMKREFGKVLIEKFFPMVNLELIANTSGAYIPGHGTPTVLLFGSHEPPQGRDLQAVLAKRSEPSTPEPASLGQVWRSIADHFSEPGFENDFISNARIERAALAKHPWSLGGGGASELKDLLEERANARLSELIDELGRSTHTGEDGVFFMSEASARRLGFEETAFTPLVKGEQVRDWMITEDEVSLFPYDRTNAEAVVPHTPAEAHYYWRYRTVLRDRQDFGQKIEARGLKWFEHSMFFPKRFLRPLGIAFAFVATHNHFALDRGGRVFKQSAPIIKLPESATEDEHLALLAYLNSSTACFWMKQIFHKKSSASQKHHSDPARAAYEFAGTGLQELPLPNLTDPVLISIAKELSRLGAKRGGWVSGRDLQGAEPSAFKSREGVARLVDAGWADYDTTTQAAAYLQEELDWRVYTLFDLAKTETRLDVPAAWILGSRPFEASAGYDAGVSERVRNTVEPAHASKLQPPHWKYRRADTHELQLLETREFKRMWRDTEQNVDQSEFRASATKAWLESVLAARLEDALRGETEVTTARSLATIIDASLSGIVAFLSESSVDLAKRLTQHDAVPYLAALTYSDAGLHTWTEWGRTWKQQQREDIGESAPVTVPPKYSQDDFLDGRFWSLRGKLDVPKERFISYPLCESDNDGEAIYGWAGWNHQQRALALGKLYLRRRNDDWTVERLTPMLAGLLELLPWVKQWHPNQSDEFGGQTAGEYFEQFLDGECRQHSLTHDDLLAWRPPKRTRTKTRVGASEAVEENAKAVKKRVSALERGLRSAKHEPVEPTEAE